MARPLDDSTQATLSRLLEEHGLTRASWLYREAERSAMTAPGAPGMYRLAANANPSESVVDVYGQGYLVQAAEVGPGLAFAESASPNWQETVEMRTLRASGAGKPGDRVEVTVRLGDILEQGGLMYPVASVTVERAWYFTLPAGSIEVREVS